MVNVSDLAERLQNETLERARAVVLESFAVDPRERALVERNREAVDVGIHAGFVATLFILVEHGILPGAFEED
jgi:hypothetical protein